MPSKIKTILILDSDIGFAKLLELSFAFVRVCEADILEGELLFGKLHSSDDPLSASLWNRFNY